MKIGSFEKYLNVAIPIIKNKDGAVLIVKRKDPIKSTEGVYHWHFPGAVVESENDYPEVVNFVYRETGYKVRPVKKISDRSNHPLGHKNIYVEFEVLSDKPDEIGEKEIVEECEWVLPEQLCDYFTSPMDFGVAEFLGLNIERPDKPKLRISVAVVKNKEGKVLIHKRKKTEDSITGARLEWTFSGGSIKPGESPQEAAVNRTAEKTGYKVNPVEVISSRKYHPFGYDITYVACETVEEEPVLDVDPRKAEKIDEILWVYPEDLENYFTSDIDLGVERYLGLTFSS